MSSDFSSNVILLFAFKILFVTIRYSGALIIDLFMCMGGVYGKDRTI